MDRFREKVNYDGPLPEAHPETGPCHLWTAAKVAGYGVFTLPGGSGGKAKLVRAHRWLWIETNGPVPEGKVLDHWACDRPECVNPQHLRPVTDRENILRSDGLAARLLAQEKCVNGHPFAGDNLRVNPRTGYRTCVTCRRRITRDSMRRKRAALRALRSAP